ncbi:MAG: plastocyanin/azurin family copper-binding protein [Acidimicrobiia bacterium]
MRPNVLGRATLAIVALLVTASVAAGCGGTDKKSSSGTATTATTEAEAPAPSGGSGSASSAKVDVEVVKYSFQPDTVSVAVGDTVTWTFKDPVAHNITGRGFTSGDMKSGAFSHKFDSAGTFKYVCNIHLAGMAGAVKVS